MASLSALPWKWLGGHGAAVVLMRWGTTNDKVTPIVPIVPITAHCCPLLPVIAHYCPLSPIVPIIAHYAQIINYKL
jgi:hypothetical protein